MKERLKELRKELKKIQNLPLREVIGELYPIVKEINDIKAGKYD